MQATLVGALRFRRPKIRAQWEALLRAEPVATPLGNPDALVHLLDWTLDEIFSLIANPLSLRRHGPPHALDETPECPCGRNPLLAYYAAGGQAMREGLILAQAAASPLDPLERDSSFAELNLVLQHIAHREIVAFCGVCQFREPNACTHVAHPAAETHVNPVDDPAHHSIGLRQ